MFSLLCYMFIIKNPSLYTKLCFTLIFYEISCLTLKWKLCLKFILTHYYSNQKDFNTKNLSIHQYFKCSWNFTIFITLLCPFHSAICSKAHLMGHMQTWPNGTDFCGCSVTCPSSRSKQTLDPAYLPHCLHFIVYFDLLP